MLVSFAIIYIKHGSCAVACHPSPVPVLCGDYEVSLVLFTNWDITGSTSPLCLKYTFLLHSAIFSYHTNGSYERTRPQAWCFQLRKSLQFLGFCATQ